MGIVSYKGRLLDRGRVHGVGIIRTGFAFFLGVQYLYLGDLLAGSLLWEEYRHIYHKYEPVIRIKKYTSNPKFVHEVN